MLVSSSGGFAKSRSAVVQNDAEQAGLTHWHHIAGTPAKRLILEAKGSCVCLLDYDHDGWPDLYETNYGKNRIYRNKYDGTFTDGGKGRRHGRHMADRRTFGDFDGDGRLDMIVANDSILNYPYINQGDGTFDDREL
jgi:hypothetical protein